MSITKLVPPSATLAVNERIRRLIEAGQPILHLAFGEAGLPVPQEVVDALTRGAPDNGYGPVAGSLSARAAALEQTLAGAARQGAAPGVLVVTLPDNPTGTVPHADEVRRTVEIADAYGLSIVSDEIYRDLAHEPGEVHSPAEYLPERTYVTSGLSKNMALGGWRIGFVRVPPGSAGRAARDAVVGLASEVWSSAPAPMQHVVAHVLAEPPEVVAHIDRSRRLHRATTLAAHDRIVRAGISCRPPSGSFYLYPDFEPARPQLAAHRVDGGDALAAHLLDRYGIGVLSGVAFGDEPSALRCRIATSLLYGETAEDRRRALAAEEPAELPWIKSSLDRLGEALGLLTAA